MKGCDIVLKLVDASEEYLKQYKEAYLLAKEKVESGNLNKRSLMFEDPDSVDIVQKHKDNRVRNKLQKGYVPSYDYFLIDDDLFIGVIHIRIELTPALLRYGGHIGYGINPKYWRQGYGTKLLKLGLEKAKQLGIKEKVLVTCDDDNIGSYKIIEYNGGILENIIENKKDGQIFLTRRYWIELK